MKSNLNSSNLSKSVKSRLAGPLASILIPTFNRAKYVGYAIESALAQTYQNIEIIIHDDASTDSTLDAIAQYKKDKRVRIIHTSVNHGMLGGWNFIQKKARGEYIKFLASDDLLEPTCVEELVRAAIAHPKAAVITCQRTFIDARGKILDTKQFANKKMIAHGRDHAHWILTTVRENRIGEPTAVLYPIRIAKKAGDYDPTFSQLADFEYWIRLLEFGDIVHINKPLCSFRVHAGSNTSAAVYDGRFITEIFALIHKYYFSTHYRKVFKLTDTDESHVRRQKTLDTLKNIKDLFVDGKISQARNYYHRLSHEVTLDYMTRTTLSFLLKK